MPAINLNSTTSVKFWSSCEFGGSSPTRRAPFVINRITCGLTAGAFWAMLRIYPESLLSDGVLAVGRGEDAPPERFPDRRTIWPCFILLALGLASGLPDFSDRLLLVTADLLTGSPVLLASRSALPGAGGSYRRILEPGPRMLPVSLELEWLRPQGHRHPTRRGVSWMKELAFVSLCGPTGGRSAGAGPGA